jgi:hypothetical protein
MKKKNPRSERIITLGSNFNGAPVYQFRLKMGVVNLNSSGGGLLSGVTQLPRSLLTSNNTNGSNIINGYQKYRFWKVECHIYGVTTGSGVARFLLSDVGLGGSPIAASQSVTIATNTASSISRATLTYTAKDYPDLDYTDKSTDTSFAELYYDNFGNSVFANSTLVYVVEVWGTFDCKLYA